MQRSERVKKSYIVYLKSICAPCGFGGVGGLKNHTSYIQPICAPCGFMMYDLRYMMYDFSTPAQIKLKKISLKSYIINPHEAQIGWIYDV